MILFRVKDANNQPVSIESDLEVRNGDFFVNVLAAHYARTGRELKDEERNKLQGDQEKLYTAYNRAIRNL